MSAIVLVPKAQLQKAYGDVPAALTPHRIWARDRVEWAMTQIAQGTAHRVIQDLQEQQGAIARHFEQRLQAHALTAAKQQELWSALTEQQAAITAAVGTLAVAIQGNTAAIQSHQQVMQAHGHAIVQLGQKIERLTEATQNAAIVRTAAEPLQLPSRGDYHHHHHDSGMYVGPVIACALAASAIVAATWGPANAPPQQTQIRVQMGQ